MVVRKRLPPEAELEIEEVVVSEEAPKMGRPSTYQKKYANTAKILCARGATDRDLADAFDVSTTCIHNWQVQYPEFGAAVREGKADIFDPMVERTLVQRAMGYFMDCEEVKVTKDGDIIRYPVRKYFPPDPACIFFWLKNRQTAKWRDVWKIDSDVTVKDERSSAELLEEIKREASELGLTLPAAIAGGGGVAPKLSPKGNGTKH